MSVQVRGQICIEKVVLLGFCCPQQLEGGRVSWRVEVGTKWGAGGLQVFLSTLLKKDLTVGGERVAA